MLISIPKYNYGEIVLGGTLNALLYSYHKNAPLIINKLSPPHRFETFEDQPALELWNKLFFILSLSGLNLGGDKVRNTRIKENEIIMATKNARVLKAAFEKLMVFDDEEVGGLPLPEKENENFIVLDWMIGRSCDKHDYDLLKTEENLVRELHFYPSERVDGNHPYTKDMVAISHLNERQLNDFEYSDTYARFKAIQMLKDSGVKGKKGGIRHYALKLEVEKREIRKEKMSSYKNLKNIEFKYNVPAALKKDSYLTKINDLFQGAV